MVSLKVKYVGTLQEVVSSIGAVEAAKRLSVPYTTLKDNLSATRQHLVMELDGAYSLLMVKSNHDKKGA